jgi:hypothetical protein
MDNLKEKTGAGDARGEKKTGDKNRGRPKVDSKTVSFRMPPQAEGFIRNEVRKLLSDIKSGRRTAMGELKSEFVFWFEGYESEFITIHAENAEEAIAKGLELHGRQIEFMMYREI